MTPIPPETVTERTIYPQLIVIVTPVTTSTIWVAITASNPDDKGELFDPAADKIYRHPTFYEIPEEVGHM